LKRMSNEQSRLIFQFFKIYSSIFFLFNVTLTSNAGFHRKSWYIVNFI
jgi:hypothetical protein